MALIDFSTNANLFYCEANYFLT